MARSGIALWRLSGGIQRRHKSVQLGWETVASFTTDSCQPCHADTYGVQSYHRNREQRHVQDIGGGRHDGGHNEDDQGRNSEDCATSISP